MFVIVNFINISVLQGYVEHTSSAGIRSRALVFWGPKALEIGSMAEEIHVDASFDVMPTSPSFRQLLVVNGIRYSQVSSDL